ncbi:50S ribosomal protein L11 [archaeon]|nr:50S ribosomal protein L11 [archaeon]
MAKETVESLVEGGKASAAPPLGPALGPLKVNIGQVVAEINKKTEAFKGMKVPVKVIVDTETKEFEIEVGTPPISQLIKKELGLKKGAGIPNKDFQGNLGLEQAIKVAKMKMNSLFVNNLKSAVKTVAGSCNSMGILVEGMTAVEFNKAVEAGKFNKELESENSEISNEKKKTLDEQLQVVKKKFIGELEKIAAAKKAKADKEAKKEAKGASAVEAPKK